MIPGTAPERWSGAYQLSEQFPGIHMAVGVHPWWLGDLEQGGLDRDLSVALGRYLGTAVCVAVGECGLDKMIPASLEAQQVVFEQHLQLACDTRSPLIIHVRKTHNETLRLLQRYRPAAGGVIHGFSGSIELARQYWALGFYLGVGGGITYPRARKTRQAVAELPLEALLLETDAPDMPLQGYQGQPNSPLQVIAIAAELARLRQQSPETIAQQTTANARQLFKL